MKAQIIIERGNDGTFSAYIGTDNIPYGILGDGNSVKETIADFNNSYEEMKAHFKANDLEFIELDFEFKYDMASFLSYYKKILSLSGLEAVTGVNQRQLGHYLSGHRKPSRVTTEKIEKNLHEFAEELNQLSFV